MPGKQAKTLSTDHIDDLLFFAERSRHPLRNRLIVLLSVKAGLRAAEIAKLSWDMVLGPSGEVGVAIELQDKIAKKRSGRSIPLHRDLREALIEVWPLGRCQGPIIQSERGGAVSVAETVVNLTGGRNQTKKPNEIWSEWQDLNLRPLRPERSALPG
jgi:integrase